MPVVPFIPAIAGVAGAAIGANAQNKAAKQGAQASQQATDATIAEQRRQFDIGQANQQPWLNVGTGALGQLASLYGLSTGMTPTTGQGASSGYNAGLPATAKMLSQGGMDFSNGSYGYANPNSSPQVGTTQAGATPVASGMAGFFTSPDYNFRQNEQMRALTARNAALGIQDSGAAQRSALQLSGNLASGEFNNYANRLSALAGVGQTAAQNTAAAGQNFANSMGQVLGNNAQNLASSYAQQGANNANLWSGIGGAVGAGVNQFLGRR